MKKSIVILISIFTVIQCFVLFSLVDKTFAMDGNNSPPPRSHMMVWFDGQTLTNNQTINLGDISQNPTSTDDIIKKEIKFHAEGGEGEVSIKAPKAEAPLIANYGDEKLNFTQWYKYNFTIDTSALGSYTSSFTINSEVLDDSKFVINFKFTIIGNGTVSSTESHDNSSESIAEVSDDPTIIEKKITTTTIKQSVSNPVVNVSLIPDNPGLIKWEKVGGGRTGEVLAKGVVWKILDWILGFIAIIAVIMFTYAGFLYLTAGGGDEQLTKGKSIMLWSSVGLGLVMLSETIVQIVYPTTGDLRDIDYGGDSLDTSKAFNTNVEASDFIISILNWLLGFLSVVVIAVLIYGGFIYLTSQGDDAQSSKGSQLVLQALIGVVIILSSFAIVNIVIGGIS